MTWNPRTIRIARALSFVLFLVSPSYAITFTVDSTADTTDATPGDGVCADAVGGCTLRAASDEGYALADSLETCVDHEEIVFANLPPFSVGFMDFGRAGRCARDVTIRGPGRDKLQIRGFLTYAGVANHSLYLSDVTIAGAETGVIHAAAQLGYSSTLQLERVAVTRNGTGIEYGFQTVTSISNCEVTANRLDGIAANDSPGLFLSIGSSVISNNGRDGVRESTMFLSLGGLVVTQNQRHGLVVGSSGQLISGQLSDSLVSDNEGAGLVIKSPPVRVASSTIARNRAGGIVVESFGEDDAVHLENLTVSGNSSQGSGAGLIVNSGSVTVVAATVTGNTADADGDGDGDGGGIFGAARISQTIVAGNMDGSGEAPDCGGTLDSGGHNLISDTTGCTVNGDIATNLTSIDPMLGPLQNNGGPTPTHALLAGSPAIDAGGTCALATDQRGVTRPQGSVCDIGAFEFACGNGLVDPGESCDDGNSADGDCCSANCQFEPSGSPCTDGNTCTTEACDGAGICAQGSAVDCGACQTCDTSAGCVASVLTGCHQPTERFSGQLQISNTTKPTLRWQWTRGEATDLADFGDPPAGDRYSVCLFDESGPTPQLALRATTSAGLCDGTPCWRAAGGSGFKYKSRTQTPDGLDTLLLKAGPDGKAKLGVSGRGAHLRLPALPLPLPLRAQLQAANGQCWEARYQELGTSRNDAKLFKSKAFQP